MGQPVGLWGTTGSSRSSPMPRVCWELKVTRSSAVRTVAVPPVPISPGKGVFLLCSVTPGTARGGAAQRSAPRGVGLGIAPGFEPGERKGSTGMLLRSGINSTRGWSGPGDERSGVAGLMQGNWDVGCGAACGITLWVCWDLKVTQSSAVHRGGSATSARCPREWVTPSTTSAHSHPKFGMDTPRSFGSHPGSGSGSSARILPVQHCCCLGAHLDTKILTFPFPGVPPSLASTRGAIGVKYSGALAAHIL